ncbi:hypothetical protein MKX01_018049 [Papaver californicum]|nr:hypothetical protein MKX01_018049 [Papaver californicum]
MPFDVFFFQILIFLGPKEAARVSVVCKSWKFVVSDNRLWILFLHNLQEESWENIDFSESCLRSGFPLLQGLGLFQVWMGKESTPSGYSATFMEFGDLESPMYSRLRHFFATIYDRMQKKPSTQPVVVAFPICHYYEAICNVPAVCSINQAILALYAARRTSGIVVDIGFRVTSVVPMKNNKIHSSASICYPSGRYDNLSLLILIFLQTWTDNYNIPLQKFTQRFQTGEILFQPRMGGLHMMGLHQAVALCMDHCQAAKETEENDRWFKTVVLAGGTACLPGLPERLAKELSGLLVSNVSTYSEAWCMTKKQSRAKYGHQSSIRGKEILRF